MIQELLKSQISILSGNQKKYYEWILEKGKFFTQVNAELSKTMAKRIDAKPKECFFNGQTIALRTELDYYEGYYITEGIPIHLEHGFNLDHNGLVVDATAHVGKIPVVEYFAVKIPLTTIMNYALEEHNYTPLLQYYYRKQHGI